MHLWPHQTEALERFDALVERGQPFRLLGQYPCGTGKTEVAARMAVRWASSRAFGRAVVCVPSAAVLAQFYRRLASLTRLPIGIERAEAHAPSRSRVIVATQNSLWSRLGRYERDTLLLYDECHHGNLDAPANLRLVRSFAHVVGLSATPWSQGCQELFGRGARLGLPLRLAQAAGLVAPHAVLPWEEPRGPWGLVFCATNDECARRAARQPSASWIGVNSGQVEARIRAWRAGKLAVLYVNRMLLEGFDEPRCDAVWLAKQTDSDIQYVQMAGRAMRARPGKVARLYCETPELQAGLAEALARCNQAQLSAV